MKRFTINQKGHYFYNIISKAFKINRPMFIKSNVNPKFYSKKGSL